VLLGLYVAYLWVLFRNPPHSVESLADTPAVSRWAYRQPGWRRPAAIRGLFGPAGALLYVPAKPFPEPMLAVAGRFGVAHLLLAKMEFAALDAAILFVLWLAQFLRPSLRDEVTIVYGAWMAILVIGFAVGRTPLLAPRYFWEAVRKHDRPAPL